MPGDRVNLEVDLIAKYVERLLPRAHERRDADGPASRGARLRPDRATRSPPSARGEIVVVVDDEDRENEGDLIMAAEYATPEKIAFFVRHTSGLICVPDDRRAARRAGHPADGQGQHRGPAHGVHLQRRLPPRHQHRHLGRRPGGHDPGAHRPGHPPGRPGPPRPHLPAALRRGRRAEAGRPHRGGRRPGPHGRALPGRRALRARQRGRDAWPGSPTSRSSARSTAC